LDSPLQARSGLTRFNASTFAKLLGALFSSATLYLHHCIELYWYKSTYDASLDAYALCTEGDWPKRIPTLHMRVCESKTATKVR
jgi:hypothetical protein